MINVDTSPAFSGGLVLFLLESKVKNRKIIVKVLFYDLESGNSVIGKNEYYKTLYEILCREQNSELSWGNYPQNYQL
jgi:hypothetical protein